jgi:hypothetical protein
MNIRRAVPGDEEVALPAVLEFAQAYAEHFKVQLCADGIKALAKRLAEPDALAVVAEEDGLIVGFLAGAVVPWYINPRYKVFEEAAWFVCRGHRKSSVGARLFLEMTKLWKDYAVDFALCRVYSGVKPDYLFFSLLPFGSNFVFWINRKWPFFHYPRFYDPNAKRAR